jgi:hypothetical protein
VRLKRIRRFLGSSRQRATVFATNLVVHEAQLAKTAISSAANAAITNGTTCTPNAETIRLSTPGPNTPPNIMKRINRANPSLSCGQRTVYQISPIG